LTRFLQLSVAGGALASVLLTGAQAQSSRRESPKGGSPTKMTPLEFALNSLARTANQPIENAAALVPFFEQLYRHQRGEMPGPVRILQYGDSHTAADDFTGELRDRLQQAFGDGGSGFSMAGRPWRTYRRYDVRSGSTKGWRTDGLVTRPGDGVYGLAGISMTATSARESVFIEDDASGFELYYYRQPGGGSVQIYDCGVPVDLLSTDGEPGPAYYHVQAGPGRHRLEVETLEERPVRLFGWVAENATGITYEPLGINGAQASVINRWDEATLAENIAHRNPDLIVLAYGTNDAGDRNNTLESYQAIFAGLLRKLRAAAPTASLLVIGPPDRSTRVRRTWQTLARVSSIIEAQRRAAREVGAAFIDLRAKMGGEGSMLQWARTELAQNDHVHFSGPGYRLLAEAVYRDLMTHYNQFLEARAAIMADSALGEAPGFPPPPEPAVR
jgi:lysophospholipase L1-like esterase